MFGNLFANLKQDENKEQKNLFNSLNIEEDSCDSYKNYKNTKDNKLHLFMFYAPWCGHCKRKMPFLKNIVNNYGNKIQVHTYNCERLKASDSFIKNINGYPTFKMGYKQKTYNIELLEFILVAVAITMKLAMKHVIENMLNDINLNSDLKSQLKDKKETFMRKYNNIHL